jgi:hypothetical protein
MDDTSLGRDNFTGRPADYVCLNKTCIECFHSIKGETMNKFPNLKKIVKSLRSASR